MGVDPVNSSEQPTVVNVSPRHPRLESRIEEFRNGKFALEKLKLLVLMTEINEIK